MNRTIKDNEHTWWFIRLYRWLCHRFKTGRWPPVFFQSLFSICWDQRPHVGQCLENALHHPEHRHGHLGPMPSWWTPRELGRFVLHCEKTWKKHLEKTWIISRPLNKSILKWECLIDLIGDAKLEVNTQGFDKNRWSIYDDLRLFVPTSSCFLATVAPHVVHVQSLGQLVFIRTPRKKWTVANMEIGKTDTVPSGNLT